MLKTDEDRERFGYALAGLATYLMIDEPAKAQAVSPAIIEQVVLVSRDALLKLYSDVANQLEELISSYNRLSPEQIETKMNQVLKPAYTQASSLGKLAAGKPRPLTQADIAEVDKQWLAEQSYVENLAKEVRDGKVGEVQFARRVRMYGYALREVYNRSWVHHKDSPAFRWHMHPGAMHCVACVAASSGSGQGLPAGYYRRGELPFYPGRSPVCLDNCMCWLEADDGDIGAPQVREPAKAE
jgi:hypothetical protein